MGVITSLGGQTHCTFFFDHVRDPGETTLIAVVLQRSRSDPTPKGPWARLRRVFSPVANHAGQAPFARMPEGWDASSDLGGRYEALLSSARRIVRVAAVEYPLPPDDSTLVLLADEASEPAGGWKVVTRTITVPSRPHYRYNKDVDKATNLRHMSGEARENQRAWTAALEADPIVRAFLHRDAGHGGA